MRLFTTTMRLIDAGMARLPVSDAAEWHRAFGHDSSKSATVAEGSSHPAVDVPDSLMPLVRRALEADRDHMREWLDSGALSEDDACDMENDLSRVESIIAGLAAVHGP